MLRERFGPELSHAELAEAEVVISELVTNALVHGSGAIRLRLTVDDDTVAGEVVDDGPGFEGEVREAGAQDVSGRGLGIVGGVAERWGIHDGSSHVWFELARRRPGSDAIAPPELGEERRPDELD